MDQIKNIPNSALEEKLLSFDNIDDIILFVKNNSSLITTELIINVIEKCSYLNDDDNCLEFLRSLPKLILQDGVIAKKIINKMDDISLFCSDILDYIPKNAYTDEFIIDLLNKSDWFVISKLSEIIPSSVYNAHLINEIFEKISISKCCEIFQYLPKELLTREMWQKLCSEDESYFSKIPSNNFDPSISKEEYDKWFEDLILQNIANTHNLDHFLHNIPKERINEKVWNKFLDKCITENVDRSYADLKYIKFENLTPQMVERAVKEIGSDQISYLPCIDKEYDFFEEEYGTWQASLDEKQKEVYRTWYEQFLIKLITETKNTDIFTYIPPMAITSAIMKTCISLNNDFIYNIDRVREPETPEQLYEYQQMLIYALSKASDVKYRNDDILERIPKSYITEEIVRYAIEQAEIYLNYTDPTANNFNELLDIAFKNKLASMGRTELTSKERELMQKFAVNNSELFKTLQLETLNPKIISAIGESSIEKIVRYKDVQSLVLEISDRDSALNTFGFALENLKNDETFIEPLIEKISKSILEQKQVLDIVSQRIDRKDIPFTDYEKCVISYLILNPQECEKITNYDDILTFVERKNSELKSVINDNESTLFAIKNAYLERILGLDYDTVADLVRIYGNDPEQLLQSYKNISSESFKELGEKEALEIIIKLKSFIESQDIDAIKSEFQKQISKERKEESFLRYKNFTFLESSLKRAYGRDTVNSLSRNTEVLKTTELEFEGEKYLVRKVDGDFNRMVSLLDAFRVSSVTDGDMYDRWNTNQMANNHALCFSLINQSNPGTALTYQRTGIIVSIDKFSYDSISAAAPYDLFSDNRRNTVITRKPQKFFSAQNMPNQTRDRYSEYDIEIQDVLSESNKYQKIQPASIICFENVDEDSIRAAIELGKKLGHPVPIDLIDRRNLAKNEMMKIVDAFNKFKSSETIDSKLIEEIITRFNNVRNAHRFSDLSNELLGEKNNNKEAPFNKEHLNQILNECLFNVEQRIRNGQVQEGLKALEDIKMTIQNERLKTFTDGEIDSVIDYNLNKLQRMYSKQTIKHLKGISSLEALSQMDNEALVSPLFEIENRNNNIQNEQLSADVIIQTVDVNKVRDNVTKVYSEGYYQDSEESFSQVVLYSDVISKMEGFDEITRRLLNEATKYCSCGKQSEFDFLYGECSAKIAGDSLAKHYSESEIKIIQAAIEVHNLKRMYRFVDRQLGIDELYQKYNLNNEQSLITEKIADCISDSVILSKQLELFQNWNRLKNNSAKKMIKFAYAMQEYMAQKKLNELSPIIRFDFKNKNSDVCKKYNIDYDYMQSPVVKLEYLKMKYPELVEIDLEAFNAKRQSLRRRQFEERTREIGIGENQVLTLDQLLQQQIIENDLELEISHDIKK